MFLRPSNNIYVQYDPLQPAEHCRYRRQIFTIRCVNSCTLFSKVYDLLKKKPMQIFWKRRKEDESANNFFFFLKKTFADMQ